MSSPEPQNDFQSILQSLRRIPADSAAWDDLQGFIEAVENLARDKLTERITPQWRLSIALAKFRETHAERLQEPDFGFCAEWHAEELPNAEAEQAERALGVVSDSMQAFAAKGAELLKTGFSGQGLLLREIAELDDHSRQKLRTLRELFRQTETKSAPVLPAARGSAQRTAASEGPKAEVLRANAEVIPAEGPAKEPMKAQPRMDESISTQPRPATERTSFKPLAGPIMPVVTTQAPKERPGEPFLKSSGANLLKVEPVRQIENAPQKERACSDEPAVAAAPLLPSLEVPGPLQSYKIFRQSHWIQPDGECAPAPWQLASFGARMTAAAEEALRQHRFSHLYVFCRAVQIKGEMPLVEPADIEALSALLADSSAPRAGWSTTRAERLRAAIERGEGDQPRWRLSAFLEALNPSLEQPLTPTEIADNILFEHDLLFNATLALLRLHPTLPLDRLRAEQSHAARPEPATILARLNQEREEFKRLVRIQYSAAGGRVKTSHSRRAWTRFADGALQPLAEKLQPGHFPNDFEHWDIDGLRLQALDLVAQHKAYADEGEVKFSDRATMDRAADEFSKLAARIVQTAAEYKTACLPVHERSNADLAALRPLLESSAFSGSGVEETCRELFRCVVFKEDKQPEVSMSLPVADIMAWPLLAPLFERNELWAGNLGNRLDLTNLGDEAILRAASILSETPLVAIASGESSFSSALGAVQRTLTHLGRRDLLPWFLNGGVLAEHERTRIHSEQTDFQGALESRLQVLRSLWRLADDLGLPCVPQVKALLDGAEKQIDQADWLHREMPLYDQWLRALNRFLEEATAQQSAQLLSQAQAAPRDIQDAAVEAVKSKRYSDAMELLHQRTPSPPLGASLRETLWREEAAKRWPDPHRTLTELRQRLNPEETLIADLLDRWLEPAAAGESARLRRSLHDLLTAEIDKNLLVPLREIEKTRIRFHVPTLLDRLEARNPTFVPQLRRFTELVIQSPRIAQTNPEAYSSSLIHAVSEGTGDHLCIFVAPRLNPAFREVAVRQFRQRAKPAAIIDDLDLCRLLAPDGQRPYGMLALIEFLFEQMDWLLLQPFSTHDGQFVQPEMFVGRTEQADELRLTMNKSRIFSGRKLGKSALLKHLAMSRRELPSGNKLRVLYYNAAGSSTEETLTDAILGEVEGKLHFALPSLTHITDAAERLKAGVAAWRRTWPTESLLIILDEADEFMATQIANYDQDKERSLSFAMMKSIPAAESDSRGLPRVRFILAGYRTTNQNKGVWANAGDVLSLEPLSENEAVDLIEGPLARLGVDAHEQAPAIARRCGYQPAVLLRFGEVLLLKLNEQHSKLLRGRVQVEGRQVTDVFNAPRVQEEIRTVVNNNFHGNRIGEIIWTALLICLRRLPPSTWMYTAAHQVLEQIRSVVPDIEWLRAIEPDEERVIAASLRDFAARQLVVLQEATEGCQLRFPHFLPVLTRDDGLESSIRQNIEALRAGAQEAQTVNTALPASDLEEIRRALRVIGPAEQPLAAIVAGAHWLAPLQHEFGGLPDRLGFLQEEIQRADVTSLSKQGRLAILNADRPTLAEILAGELGNVPTLLLGGADLLRFALESEEQSQGSLLYAYGLHRLNEARLTWWFERLRGWLFPAPGWMSRIMEVTSGVPLLVGLIDEFLEARLEPGGDVSTEDCLLLESLLGEVAQLGVERLKRSPVEGGLKERERQLLKMAAIVAQYGDFEMSYELGINQWKNFESELPGYPPLEATLQDRLAVAFLRFSGLLPLDARGHVRLRENDAFCKMAPLL